MSYRLINANNITFNSDGFITAENIEKMPCIYADLPNGMDGEHYVLEQQSMLDKIRAEIEQKIEQERFARSVFRGEEKDAVNAEQCTGSIFAYNNVIKIIDKYNTESEDKE